MRHDGEAEKTRVALAGSERILPAGAVIEGPVEGSAQASITIVLRAKTPSHVRAAELANEAPQRRSYVSREAFARDFGAAEADVSAVTKFAKEFGLTVVSSDLARRSVLLSGTIGELSEAFGAALHMYRIGDAVFRGRSGALTLPASLDGIVLGVFGLDTRPQARAQFRRAVRPAKAAAAAVSYTPLQLAEAYGFPAGLDGSGQTIALLELGGGLTAADLETYFKGLGLTQPSVTAVSVDGGTNAPAGDANSADAEVMLDIEVAGAIAPGAKIVVYFAPNTDQGFLDAVTTIVHDAQNAPSILSISWGGPESTWTQQSFDSFDAAFADAATLGMTVMCAAGDSGSADGVTDGSQHVDFPASSPHVLACGGTRLALKAAARGSEIVWNGGSSDGATGGGISDAFAVPAWQSTAKIPKSVNKNKRVGRGVPDVAGDADPQSGYDVQVDGSAIVLGGTSAVAPLWAGLVARFNQHAGAHAGFINPVLYANPSALFDITSGNNGKYKAGKGWDACTGLGTPNGAALLALFAPTAPAPDPQPGKPAKPAKPAKPKKPVKAKKAKKIAEKAAKASKKAAKSAKKAAKNIAAKTAKQSKK